MYASDVLIQIVRSANTWCIQLHSEQYPNSLVIDPAITQWIIDPSETNSEFRDRMRRIAKGSQLFQLLPLQKTVTTWKVFTWRDPWFNLAVTSDRRSPRIVDVSISTCSQQRPTVIRFQILNFDFKTRITPLTDATAPAVATQNSKKLSRYERPPVI